MAKVILLKSMDNHRYKDVIKERIEIALKYYPELSHETIYVGILSEKDYAKGRADSLNKIIKFPVNEIPSFVTVFHELAHLAIRKRVEQGEKLPTTSEEFCSIFAMSRMPPELIDEDRVPYLGIPKIPIRYIPALCKKALEYRKRHRDYIRWLREKAGLNIWGQPDEETERRLICEIEAILKED
jgi:hypothetical protein